MNQLTISRRALDAIIGFEITSKAYYEKYYSRPTWPGLDSGVTIGIGYDIGYNTAVELQNDWEQVLEQKIINRLAQVACITGTKARHALTILNDIEIPYQSSEYVFENVSVKKFAKKLVNCYPGAEELTPDAAGALLSLVFNRGTALVGHRRAEMAAIKPLILVKDYKGIAGELRAMKHLWDGVKDNDTVNEKRVTGLLDRREFEAQLVMSQREYETEDLINVTF